MEQYTLVRHSGYTVAADPAREDHVEVAELTHTQTYTVKRAGGRLYPTRAEAHTAETTHNQHPTGHFSSLKIAGAEIHIPQ